MYSIRYLCIYHHPRSLASCTWKCLQSNTGSISSIRVFISKYTKQIGIIPPYNARITEEPRKRTNAPTKNNQLRWMVCSDPQGRAHTFAGWKVKVHAIPENVISNYSTFHRSVDNYIGEFFNKCHQHVCQHDMK